MNIFCSLNKIYFTDVAMEDTARNNDQMIDAKVLTTRSINLAGNITAQSLPISIFVDTTASQFTFSQLPPTSVINKRLT
jgi:hypothetical protein